MFLGTVGPCLPPVLVLAFAAELTNRLCKGPERKYLGILHVIFKAFCAERREQKAHRQQSLASRGILHIRGTVPVL